jgi:hypothetical protein
MHTNDESWSTRSTAETMHETTREEREIRRVTSHGRATRSRTQECKYSWKMEIRYAVSFWKQTGPGQTVSPPFQTLHDQSVPKSALSCVFSLMSYQFPSRLAITEVGQVHTYGPDTARQFLMLTTSGLGAVLRQDSPTRHISYLYLLRIY